MNASVGRSDDEVEGGISSLRLKRHKEEMKIQAGRNYHRCHFKELEDKQEIIGECVCIKSQNCGEGRDIEEKKGVGLKFS